jgi:hypothetical protein
MSDTTRLTWRAVLKNNGPTAITDIRLILQTQPDALFSYLATPNIDVEVSSRIYGPASHKGPVGADGLSSPEYILMRVPRIQPGQVGVITAFLLLVDPPTLPMPGHYFYFVGANELPTTKVQQQTISAVEAIETEHLTAGFSPVYLGSPSYEGFSDRYTIEKAGDPLLTRETTCKTPSLPWPYALQSPAEDLTRSGIVVPQRF